MKLPDTILENLKHAEGRALATLAPDGPHVVAVSSIICNDDEIVIVDYFMSKTIDNIQANPKVALAWWSELRGYQIKGTVVYETTGELFDLATDFAAKKFPERTVKGVLRITPTVVYDITASTQRPTTPLKV